MTSRSQPVYEASYQVSIAEPDHFIFWRDCARQFVRAGVPPEQIIWNESDNARADLFAASDSELPVPPPGAPQPYVSRIYLDLASKGFLHSDSGRFALLYRLLWRLQTQPRLMEDAADADVLRLRELVRHVRRDMHKMRAFVRFRVVVEPDGGERYVAWFEPAHHILRANARFFVDRFTNMRWSILTPRGSLFWDGAVLQEGRGAQRSDAPTGDPTEDIWKRYYAAIFNPARLKVGAMLREMPRRYWKNMPEAALIPDLIAGAQAREAAMIEQGAPLFDEERPNSLAAMGDAIQTCRRCPIGCHGSRAVMGKGRDSAALMIVDEQPHDAGERQDQPVTNMAGQILDRHLEQAGVDRQSIYLTHAVKHGNVQACGQSRQLQPPSIREIDLCRWWLDSERALIRPRHILILGARAARAVLGRTVIVTRERGRPIAGEDCTVWVTMNPNALLQMTDNREREEAMFQADIRKMAAMLKSDG